MTRPVLTLVWVILTLSGSLSAAQQSTYRKIDASAVLSAIDRMAARAVWPGFDPRKYPVAVYDGSDTFLFRHPEPPDGFKETGTPGIFSYHGRHPAMVADTVATLGNQPTATVVAGLPGTQSEERAAAVTIHELFHLYQGKQFPGWESDLQVLLSYPRQSKENLKLSFLEHVALARALKQSDQKEASAWLRLALDMRRKRFAALGAEHSHFEITNELHEGLASYMEKSALGTAAGTAELEAGPDANKIRGWAYVLGPAKASLLDRLMPRWKQMLATWRLVSLDAMLEMASGNGEMASMPKAEIDRITSLAEQRIDEYGRTLEKTRAIFADAGTWRVIVIAPPKGSMNIAGIDPQNQIALSANEIVHIRLLKLMARSGQLSLLNPNWRSDTLEGVTALAEHQGMWQVGKATFAGFGHRPEVSLDGDRVSIKAEGFELNFSPASLKDEGKTLSVTLQ
jgi:hypothetical protein